MKTVFIVLAVVSFAVAFIIPVARKWRFTPYVYWASWGLGALFCFPLMPTLKASVGVFVIIIFGAGWMALRWDPWLYGSKKPGIQDRFPDWVNKKYNKNHPPLNRYEKRKRQDS